MSGGKVVLLTRPAQPPAPICADPQTTKHDERHECAKSGQCSGSSAHPLGPETEGSFHEPVRQLSRNESRYGGEDRRIEALSRAAMKWSGSCAV